MMAGVHRVVRIACVTAAVVLAAACGSQGAKQPAAGQVLVPAGGTDGGVVVTLATEPNPPAKGDNQFVVTVAKPDGTPVTDGTVTAVLTMPAMPSMNMPAMRTTTTLAHSGEGRYRGTGELSMAGTWEVAISVAQRGVPLASRRASIVAK